MIAIVVKRGLAGYSLCLKSLCNPFQCLQQPGSPGMLCAERALLLCLQALRELQACQARMEHPEPQVQALSTAAKVCGVHRQNTCFTTPWLKTRGICLSCH